METGETIHRELAVSLNGEVWSLLKKDDRSAEEERLMTLAAHASLYHWLQVGTVVNDQRGEWMICHVYATLGLGEAALRHAERCAEITERHPDDMKDFDIAYASEGLARAHSVLGNNEQSDALKGKARQFGSQIAGDEDRKIFEGDLAEW
ncbi:MAG: hypothetical protein QF898_18870 [SAR202 cluster bacterium]|nr:hypothetical protein [SAR202 cluster bacterium]MDP6513028.1 hypothetical protein [SAR202 cluster bacterium]MDP6713569.1 hypothetical protein [SAR202 cluster bacterium]